MRFPLSTAHWLPSLARKCVRESEKGRLNSAGEFVVTSERTRSQADNFQDCIDKLYDIIVKACELPKPTDAAKLQRVKQLYLQHAHVLRIRSRQRAHASSYVPLCGQCGRREEAQTRAEIVQIRQEIQSARTVLATQQVNPPLCQMNTG